MAQINQYMAEQNSWEQVFPTLSDSARTCRHEFGYYVNNRVCDNQFNCKDCAIHINVKRLMESRRRDGWREKPAGDEIFGLHLPADRLYHRGHSWIREESDGTYTVGLDDFGRRLIGKPESIDYPDIGSDVQMNEPMCIIKRENTDVSLLSPLSGKIIETGNAETDWYIKIKPETNTGVTEHLLRGTEVTKWILHDIERLQVSLSDDQLGVSFADGGVLLDDLPTAYPGADWNRIYKDLFLQG
jgi:glycine cleavage system H protein